MASSRTPPPTPQMLTSSFPPLHPPPRSGQAALLGHHPRRHAAAPRRRKRRRWPVGHWTATCRTLRAGASGLTAVQLERGSFHSPHAPPGAVAPGPGLQVVAAAA